MTTNPIAEYIKREYIELNSLMYKTILNKYFGGTLPEKPSPEWSPEKLKLYEKVKIIIPLMHVAILTGSEGSTVFGESD